MLRRLLIFFSYGLWEAKLESLSKPLAWFLSFIRIFTLAFQGFKADKCVLQASALTYYTLLSIVPILAMAFGVAKGFGFEEILEQELMKHLQSQETIIAHGIKYAHNMLQNTRGGIIAGVGVVLLFWSVIRMIGTIEEVFNHIWSITEGRSLIRKCSDYLSISIIAPLFFIISNAITVMLVGGLKGLSNALPVISESTFLVQLFLSILPYLVICLLFTFLYVFLPNTKVSTSAASLASLMTGALYHGFHWAYIHFQIDITSYGAIYGSFAALPLFLVWLHISWTIILFGAELTFAFQNVNKYAGELSIHPLSQSHKRLYALHLVHTLIKNCAAHHPPLSFSALIEKVNIPPRALQRVLNELIDCGILLKTKIKGERAYHPCWDINHLTVQRLFYVMEHHGSPLPKNKRLHAFLKIINGLEKDMKASHDNQLIKEI